MSTLVNLGLHENRLSKFITEKHYDFYTSKPVLYTLAHALIIMEWEGTQEILFDAFVDNKNELLSFSNTLSHLGYKTNTSQVPLNKLSNDNVPSFIEVNDFQALLLSVSDEKLKILDFKNNTIIEINKENTPCTICEIDHYSRVFREPSIEVIDKKNWLKHTFNRYGKEIKSLLWLSLTINFLAALQPMFIMSVYNFALTSGSSTTLFGIALIAVFIAFAEFYFKKLRVSILSESGKDLAVHISYNVTSKLLWMPYAMTSKAGVSTQIARLKDIDQFRKLVTSETTLSYFDLPFILVFISFIMIMSGPAALTVLAGILVMYVFCAISRVIYNQAIIKSSRASTMVSHYWNELLLNLPVIQGLPILDILQYRFKAAYSQNLNDSENVTLVSGNIQRAGQSLTQIIGTTCIIVAVVSVMSGDVDSGGMLAIVILVWKALGPIMSIYNLLLKVVSLKSSAAQIDKMMSLDDDRTLMEKSPPVDTFTGIFSIDSLSYRYQESTQGLTNLGFNIMQEEKISIYGISGSGKTTVLSILAGLEERYQGSIFIDGYNIKQFNNYRYRRAINYIPYNMHIFDATLKDNFLLHNGSINNAEIDDILSFFELKHWFPEGLETPLSNSIVQKLPSGIAQLLRLAIGLGACRHKVVIIDEPFTGSEKEYSKYFIKLFSEKLRASTVIFTTSDASLVSTSNKCLFLDEDGNQKFFGLSDKVIQSLGKEI